ncbi:hypothetical protein RQM47_14770 [Rubrivirga sp. S365]|uniref:Uncharacterized protein n=1 Tax=Rubrivirga litoralis TaxID=3075598 RepID=A0ABU3BRF2_9BACT|nr:MULTISPECIES: hypothetical protein [unclassified Rubrivirga]MDT0631853.1 hypothetical protein [Rubrivirga sp. F394]MDT7857906.1 hypothetical protein [Rubrivirga sp. S365]
MRGSTPDTNRDTLDQTAAALDGPITSLTPSAALGMVDLWRTACLDADGMDLSGVAAGLSDLRDLLSGDSLDGRAIADTLAGLADSTQAAAAQADDDRLRPTLERLATNLGRAATALGA